MPNLLAMSFEGELAPSFDLRCLRPGKKPPDGWGIGYYTGGELAASVLKEPAPPPGSIRSELIKAWEHLASSLFVLQIRTATWGRISVANTQPFQRSFSGRDWLFAHAGSLHQRLEVPLDARFRPVGSTDTEAIFCTLLGRIAGAGWRSLNDADPEILRSWCAEINTHGALSIVFSDGADLCVYADANDQGPMYLWHLLPPYPRLAFGDAELSVDLTRRGINSRKGVIVSSSWLDSECDRQTEWQRITPGHLVLVRQGAIHREVGPMLGGVQVAPLVRKRFRPVRAEKRRLDVKHRTTYRYEKPVERSSHLLRLVPVHDRLQRLVQSQITLSVDGTQRDYEDVFGNQVRHVLIETPFTELVIEARSSVELRDVDPLSFRPVRERSTIPLVWMPWQRHMLQPFLLPPESPDSELEELTEYAMTFVVRNDYDLLDTLLDLNSSIFEEYEYKQGATTIGTTPFEVYANRRGVCQDFANLFICMARLLGIPARYVCGYVYTGNRDPNRRQSEASHAWVQVYLPEVGWRGFDPTNGVLTQSDHVRVAVGRNYVDATPTAGTIYVGGGPETLLVDVQVEPA